MATYKNTGTQVREIARTLGEDLPLHGDGYNDLGEGLDAINKAAAKITALKNNFLYQHDITITKGAKAAIIHVLSFLNYEFTDFRAL